MIHSFLYFSFLPLFVFTSFECSTIDKKSDDKQLNDSTAFFQNEFFPVSVGNHWRYSIEKPGEEKDNYDVEITDQEKTFDEIKVVFNSFPFFWLKEEKTTLIVKESGDVYIIDENKNESLLIPRDSDIREGFNWKMGEWNASIINTHEKIKTMNVVYEDCIHINYTISISFNSELWLSKNTGIVKWGFNRTNPPSLNFTYYLLDKFESKH
ncbi:MAG: hypothetical protein ISS16_01325 [Ignavibacteria bacterium]|nr:hypothetical protein [Ignavibacteria bacterium]